MAKEKPPVSPAIRELRAHKVEFTDHLYEYEEKGGTSPFGTRRKMPVYMEQTILELPKIYINGGKRGYLVGLAPQDVVKILAPKMVKVGIV